MSVNILSNVEELVDKLTVSEQLQLVEKVIRRIQLSVPTHKKPQDLYGIWRNHFPDDADIDEALHEIRNAWENKTITESELADTIW